MKPTRLCLVPAAFAGCLALTLLPGAATFAQPAAAVPPAPGAIPAPLEQKTKFVQLLEAAEKFAARAEFSYAILFYNDALLARQAPEDSRYDGRMQQLHALLAAQNVPVEVTITSDGKTRVQIANFSTPSQETVIHLRLYPRDYVIVGTRSGYREVHVLAEVRAGAPPKTYAVVCTEREQPTQPE